MFAGIDWRALRKYKKLKKKMTTNQSDQSRGHASKLAREMLGKVMIINSER